MDNLQYQLYKKTELITTLKNINELGSWCIANKFNGLIFTPFKTKFECTNIVVVLIL